MKHGLQEQKCSVRDIKVFNGLQGLECIESDWRRITEAMEKAGFYHAYEWCHAYMSHLETRPNDVYFFLVRKNNEAVAVVPLRKRLDFFYGLKLRAWETPHTNQMPLCDFVVIDNINVSEVFQGVLSEINLQGQYKHDAIFLTKVLEGDNASKLIAPNALKQKLVERTTFSKYLNCSNAKEATEVLGTGKFRRNLRRLEKRLGSKGEIVYKYVQDAKEIMDVFPQFLEVEASGWKGGTGTKTAIKLDEHVKAFYTELLETFGELGKCRINLLLLNESPVAAQFCLLDDGRINLIKIGHDPTYQECSPGFLLIKKVFEDNCGQNHINQISFVTGAEWNDIFKPEKLDVFSIEIFNTTTKGRLVFFAKKLKETLKGWIRGHNQTTTQCIE